MIQTEIEQNFDVFSRSPEGVGTLITQARGRIVAFEAIDAALGTPETAADSIAYRIYFSDLLRRGVAFGLEGLVAETRIIIPAQITEIRATIKQHHNSTSEVVNLIK